MNKFSGKNALITGGSSGIGLAIARRLTTLGANVWLLARREELLMDAQKELQGLSTKEAQEIEIIPCDVTDQSSLSKSLGQVCDKVPFHFCFNSAGVAEPGDFLSLSIDKFHWMMDVNYFGIVHTCQIVLPGMLERKNGHIINISSVVGYLSTPFYSAYGPTKMAVRALTETLRAEYRHSGVRFSVVYPPDTQTPQLDYENQFKPNLLKEVEKGMGVMDPDVVAAATLKGVERKRFHILPGRSNWLMFHAARLLNEGTFALLDSELDQAESRLRKKFSK